MKEGEKVLNKPRPIDFEINKNGCFNLTSHKPNKDGYSPININRVRKLAHRHVYEEMFGLIQEGLVVRHKCDNPRCINPEHLELGTHADNARDMYSRRRSYSRIGENNSCARLSEKQVIEIKEALINGVNGSILAEKYNVTNSQINRIKKGKVWTSVVSDDDIRKMKKVNCLEKRYVTIDGETKTLKEWCQTFGIKYGTVTSRICRGLSDVEALKIPLKRKLR